MNKEQKLRGNISFHAEDFAKNDYASLFAKNNSVDHWALDALQKLKEAIAAYDAHMKDKESDQ